MMLPHMIITDGELQSSQLPYHKIGLHAILTGLVRVSKWEPQHIDDQACCQQSQQVQDSVNIILHHETASSTLHQSGPCV